MENFSKEFKTQFEENTNKSDQKCEIHGRYKIVIKATGHIECIDCFKERIQRESELLARKAYEKERQKQIEFYLNKFSSLNEELREASFENFIVGSKNEKEKLDFARGIAKEYKNGSNNNVVFKGGVGVGKSHLAHAILKELSVDQKEVCIFVNLVDLMSKVNFDNRDTFIEKITEAKYCVLDDLGSEMANSFSENMIYEILDKRSRTIITTNLTGNDIIEKYGKRVYSRIMKGVDDKHFMSFEDLKDKRRMLF